MARSRSFSSIPMISHFHKMCSFVPHCRLAFVGCQDARSSFSDTCPTSKRQPFQHQTHELKRKPSPTKQPLFPHFWPQHLHIHSFIETAPASSPFRHFLPPSF